MCCMDQPAIPTYTNHEHLSGKYYAVRRTHTENILRTTRRDGKMRFKQTRITWVIHFNQKYVNFYFGSIQLCVCDVSQCDTESIEWERDETPCDILWSAWSQHESVEYLFIDENEVEDGIKLINKLCVCCYCGSAHSNRTVQIHQKYIFMRFHSIASTATLDILFGKNRNGKHKHTHNSDLLTLCFWSHKSLVPHQFYSLKNWDLKSHVPHNSNAAHICA